MTREHTNLRVVSNSAALRDAYEGTRLAYEIRPRTAVPLVPKSAIIRAFHRVLRIIPLYDILCTAVLVVLIVLSFFVEIASAGHERETSATETSTLRVVGNDGRVLNSARGRC